MLVTISSSLTPASAAKQYLRPLELARRVLAAAQKCRKFGALGLGQFYMIAYIHLSLRVGDPDESTDEANF